MLKIIQIPLLSDNYSYLIIDKATKTSACVDPADSEGVIKVLKNYDIGLDYILNTHHHNDHTGGNLELKKKYGCKIIGCYADQHRIPGIDIKLNDKETFNIGHSSLIVIETPGHTVGHICFYFRDQHILFSGDTLFSLGCGRLFEGSFEEMTESILKIRSLPKETKIYCGHEYTESNASFANYLDKRDFLLKKKIIEIKDKRSKSIPTVPFLLEEEMKLNPFLKFDNIEYLDTINLDNVTKVENFKKIRLMKDNF